MFKRLAVLWTVVRGDAMALWRALKHPLSPTWLKWATGFIVLYLISPIDLLPDAIPFLGVVDDIVLIPLAIRAILNRLPTQVRADIGARPL